MCLFEKDKNVGIRNNNVNFSFSSCVDQPTKYPLFCKFLCVYFLFDVLLYLSLNPCH